MYTIVPFATPQGFTVHDLGKSCYIDLARAKSEALVNITYKQKKLDRLMLNRDGNENGFETNRSN